MDICIDFDGTCVEHDYPKVGKDVPYAVLTLKKLIDNGHRLILFTMRSDSSNGEFLTDAVNWFASHDIPLYGIQVNPIQAQWTTSPKAYGQLYIDDAAFGCPLMNNGIHTRPYVNWMAVNAGLTESGVIKT